jgi:hypothetical protein
MAVDYGEIKDFDKCMTCGHTALDHHASYIVGFMDPHIQWCEVYPACEVDCMVFKPYNNEDEFMMPYIPEDMEDWND